MKNVQLRIASVKFGVCLVANKHCLEAEEPFFLPSWETGFSSYSLPHTLFSVMRGRDPSNNCYLHPVLQICSYSWRILCIVSTAPVTTGEREAVKTKEAWLKLHVDQTALAELPEVWELCWKLSVHLKFSKVVSNRSKSAYWKHKLISWECWGGY